MTAEPFLRVESREELVYLLGEACELEHALMCEYLYAQFSLKRDASEGVTPEQLARIQAWESVLVEVIKQEMLHLALATNILTALGAAPHFERPNLPILSRWYPPEVQLALLPFGEQALRHFMYLERPEGMLLADAEGFGARPAAPPPAIVDQAVVAAPEMWWTVGHLYRGIEAGLARLCARRGADAVFIGPPAAQAVTATFEWEELPTSAATTMRAPSCSTPTTASVTCLPMNSTSRSLQSLWFRTCCGDAARWAGATGLQGRRSVRVGWGALWSRHGAASR